MSELSEAIEAAILAGLTTPKSASVDGRSATARDIRELIEAAAHVQETEAGRRTTLGVKFFRTRPPGGQSE